MYDVRRSLWFFNQLKYWESISVVQSSSVVPDHVALLPIVALLLPSVYPYRYISLRCATLSRRVWRCDSIKIPTELAISRVRADITRQKIKIPTYMAKKSTMYFHYIMTIIPYILGLISYWCEYIIELLYRRSNEIPQRTRRANWRGESKNINYLQKVVDKW